MNSEFFIYKKRFVTFLLLLGYTWMHVKLTGLYVDATLEQLAAFSARLPFGQRLLVPSVVHFLTSYFPLNPVPLFFLGEFLFVWATWLALYALLRYEFLPVKAEALSWLFFLILPLISVVNYRLTAGGEMTFFYPSDSASLFFMTLGYLLCLQKNWKFFIPLIFIATLNRESAILLVLLIPALYWQNFREYWKPFIGAAFSYLFARVLVLFLVRNLPGGLVEWYFRKSAHTYFEVNLYWLLNMQHLLLFIFCFAGMPAFWFCFYDYIPNRYRPVRYLALAYFLGLAMVGNFMEARIFGEIFVLLYLPVCVGLGRWLMALKPFEVKKTTAALINRYAILMILFVVFVARVPLNWGVIWLSRQHF